MPVSEPQKIAIVGTGYVGLTTGVCFAHLGHRVICVDNDEQKITLLKQSKSPIYEPGIEELIAATVQAGKLSFTTDLTGAVQQSDVIFICVNTPPKEDGQADLRFVEQVAREIAVAMDGQYKLVVDKSTVPVHTAEKVRQTIERHRQNNGQFDVASNPEFLREGNAITDTLRPDRIVIGTDTDRAKTLLLKVYAPLIDSEHTPVKTVSVRSAELIKHGANTFLAAKISYANLIAEICEQANADALEVLEAIGLDPRIGKQFLNPGIGFGGSCFPKDIAAFKKTAEQLGVDSAMIQAIEQINEHAWQRFVKKIRQELWVLDGKTIAVLGLAFKPNTDDTRNAPAKKIVEALRNDGALIRAYDPQAAERFKHMFTDLTYCASALEAAKQADALVLCTEWEEFKKINLSELAAVMKTPVLFDGRNAINSKAAIQAGFQYFGVGR